MQASDTRRSTNVQFYSYATTKSLVLAKIVSFQRFPVRTGVRWFDGQSCTYTYLIAGVNSKGAIIVNPIIELAERYKFYSTTRLKLIYYMNTHIHSDHVCETGKLKELLPGCQNVIFRSSIAKAVILLDPNSKIKFGRHELITKPTPGHERVPM